MSPKSAPCGPVERVFVERIPCPDTKLLTASVGGRGRENSDFCRLLEFQASSCPYVTAAVQAGLTLQRGQSDQSLFEVRWNLAYTSYTL